MTRYDRVRVCWPFKISDLLGRETTLSNTLCALKDAAQKTFFDILKARGEKLLRYPPLIAADLSPPALREGMSLLLEIIENYDSVMVPVSGKKPTFEPVISALLDPIIQMCERAAEAHKFKGVHPSPRSKTTPDSSQHRRSSIDAILDNNPSNPLSSIHETLSRIFLINCLWAIRQPLLEHEVASAYAKKLGSMLESHIHGLVDKEVDALLL